MLNRNLTYLRKSKELTQGGLAIKLGLTRSTYADYETGKTEPGAKVLLKIAEYFNVTIDALVRGDLTSPLFLQRQQPATLLQEGIRVLPITVDRKQREYIQYVSAAAVAGYVSEYSQAEFIEQLPYFRLPKLPEGSYRAFDVQGDSMLPIQDGYVVIGQYIEHARDLKEGGRYILVTKNGGVVFKRISRDPRRSGQLILISDNPIYSPYTTDLTDLFEAWEMVAFIGFPNIYQDTQHLLNARLQSIEQKIDTIISDLN